MLTGNAWLARCDRHAREPLALLAGLLFVLAALQLLDVLGAGHRAGAAAARPVFGLLRRVQVALAHYAAGDAVPVQLAEVAHGERHVAPPLVLHDEVSGVRRDDAVLAGEAGHLVLQLA